MKAILLGAGTRAGVLETVERLRPDMERVCEIVHADFTGKDDISRIDADLVLIFGGDGSVLRAAHQMGERQLPTLAVGLGTLGFLSTVRVEALIPLLQRPDLLRLPVHEYLLLRCRVLRPKPDGEVLLADRLGLNELSIQGGSPLRLIHVTLSIDGEPITTYRCDGLILSTPVGSTAHNLSAGGPILRKELNAVVISPISPHTLSHRPVVESADRCFELRIADRVASVILDGQEIAEIGPEDIVSVRKADVAFRMIAVPGHSDYRALEERLGWSGQIATLR